MTRRTRSPSTCRMWTLRAKDRGSLDHRLFFVDEKKGREMIILLVLLFVLLFFGLGFAVHLLWIVAAIVFFVWIIGLALGRGSSGGTTSTGGEPSR